jgi:uncharacterized protein YciI
MEGATDANLSSKTAIQEDRKRYRKQHKEFLRTLRKEDFKRILGVIIGPRSIDVKRFPGTGQEMVADVEDFYTNDGR